MSTESFVTVPPDSDGKRLRALNYTLSGQNAAQSVWSEVINIGDPQSGAYLALVNASGALSVSASGDAVSISGNVVGVYAASQQSGWMAVISGVGATSGQLQVASSGLGTVAVSSGSVIPVMAASLQSGGSVAVSGVGATSGQLNIASSGFGTVAVASGGIIPISIISGNVVALSGIVEIVSGQTVTVVSSGIGTIAVSSGGVIPTILASAQSGGLVGISGGALTVSGSVQVSGSVGLQVLGSGNTLLSVGYASGITTGYIPIGGASGVALGVTVSGLVGISGGGLTVSGFVGTLSGGTLPVSLVSGSIAALSGLPVTVSGVTAEVSGDTVVIAASGTFPLTMYSGALNVNVSGIGTITTVLAGYQSGVLVGISGGSVGLSGLQGVAISGSVTVLPNAYQSGQLVVISGVYVDPAGGDTRAFPNSSTPLLGVTNAANAYGGNSWDRIRTVAGSSGVTGVIGIQATLPAPWTYKNVSGAVVSNIWQSGGVFVHAVNINTYSSGLAFRVRDAQSGAAGTIVGTVSPDAGSVTNVGLPPTTLLYDAVFVTGLVVETSGTNWDLTVFYRGLLS